MTGNRSIDLFEAQYRRQIAARDFAPNPFEVSALPYVTGRVLDLACGLGTLSLAAAREGSEVVAVDASTTAIEYLAAVAGEENLPLTAVKADIKSFEIPGVFDTVLAIGILMFFSRDVALGLLDRVQRAVRPGGCAAVTVLVDGTTFMDLFDGDQYYLFAADELERKFADWNILWSRQGEFAGPNSTVKRFSTVIARKP